MNAQQFSDQEADVAMQVAGFDAAANIAEIATSLRRNGAAIVRELAPRWLMDKIREEVLNSVSEEDLKSSTNLWPEGNRTVGALVAVSRTYVEELLIHPRILQIADATLLPLHPMAPTEGDNGKRHSRGDFIKVPDGTQVVWSSTNSQEGPNCHHYTVGASAMLEVGPGMKSHQVLHRENAVYQPYIEHLPMREFIMSAMWAGTDFTEDNGATRLVPGSHRWPEERIAQESEIMQAVMPKGSVVLWLSRILHGAAKSASEAPRTGFFNSYIADWLRPEENQYIAVPVPVAETLPDLAQRIIGYSASRSLGWVKGRDTNNVLKPGSGAPL